MARNVSLVGRIPGLRHVPFNIPVPVDAAGGAYAWVGQGHTKAAGVLSFSTLTIPPAKGVGFVVVAEELLKGAPGSAVVLRDALVSGLARFMDKQFTDPAVAAVADLHPLQLRTGQRPSRARPTLPMISRC